MSGTGLRVRGRVSDEELTNVQAIQQLAGRSGPKSHRAATEEQRGVERIAVSLVTQTGTESHIRHGCTVMDKHRALSSHSIQMYVLFDVKFLLFLNKDLLKVCV